MTAILWFAVALCGIVGFVAFIAPEFATQQSVFLFAKWAALRTEQAKQRDLQLFALVSRLHAGKEINSFLGG